MHLPDAFNPNKLFIKHVELPQVLHVDMWLHPYEAPPKFNQEDVHSIHLSLSLLPPFTWHGRFFVYIQPGFCPRTPSANHVPAVKLQTALLSAVSWRFSHSCDPPPPRPPPALHLVTRWTFTQKHYDPSIMMETLSQISCIGYGVFF